MIRTRIVRVPGGTGTSALRGNSVVVASRSAGVTGPIVMLKDAPPEALIAAIHTVAAGEALLAPSITRRLIGAFTSAPARRRRNRRLRERPAATGRDQSIRARSPAALAVPNRDDPVRPCGCRSVPQRTRQAVNQKARSAASGSTIHDRSTPPRLDYTIATRTGKKPELSPDDPRVATPIFTLREAATHLGVPQSTMSGWVRRADSKAPLITRLPKHGQQATVPFIGFAEAFVLASFRRAGVPLQRIRPAVEVLSAEIGVEHALASKRLYTDGAEVLYDYASGGGRGFELVVLRTQQRQFSDLVKGYLQRIQYGHDGWASRVELPVYRGAPVAVDPGIAFGQPFLLSSGARVEDLVDRFQAGDGMADIAADFDVPPEQVEDVLRVATLAAS